MSLIALLYNLIILGVIFYVLWWGLGKMALPEPINKTCIVVVVIATIVALFSLLNGNLLFPVPSLTG